MTRTPRLLLLVMVAIVAHVVVKLALVWFPSVGAILAPALGGLFGYCVGVRFGRALLRRSK